MRILSFVLILTWIGCNPGSDSRLIESIQNDSLFSLVKYKALQTVKTGFNAGDGYGEVWIRDYNTFIRLSAQAFPSNELKRNLLVFFKLQGRDGNIIDGFVPRAKAGEDYDGITTDLESNFVGHKNTVETDQETSLVQAVYKFIEATGDTIILREMVGQQTVGDRMEDAMRYLMKNRYNEKYGLIYGATTADWGDVQPEGGWGVDISDSTHYAIDIYDNAMFIIALDNLIELIPESAYHWQPIRDEVAANCRKYLWDAEHQKFIPHLYLDGSPFPADFDENAIFYHGGTAVAIEAGLLTPEEVKNSLNRMIQDVKDAHAASIGLTMYPVYPEGYFKNKVMGPYSYQNGGDWTWFGGRMIQQLIRYDMVAEAYEQIQPMVQRVKANNGFYEWYTVDNQPKGSGTFRGSAGVLYDAIKMFEVYAQENNR
ncbi:MAG: hypothetical protein KDC28_08830 [Saprospiraceae bacterium]|nr:hypothetical protein [Saprospiraceae bacterium]MCB9320031.1 hypothetical protein [Lewinellaceae bacterium]